MIRIGLTGNYDAAMGQQLLSMAYLSAVSDNGGCPFVLPPMGDDAALIETMLDGVDGLLFTGGADFTAELLGEPLLPESGSLNPQRDRFEMPLIKAAMGRQMPILAICRGEQLMALACGGHLFQDLPSQYDPSASCHNQKEGRDVATHEVEILPGTMLEGILCKDSHTFRVNSFHHQAVRDLYKREADAPCERLPHAPLLRVSALSSDGVVEAVESVECKPFIGVQWHPECLTKSEPVMNSLFQWLSRQAELYRKARNVQHSFISFDAHCDVPMFYDGDYDINRGGTIERGKIDFSAKGEESNEIIDSRVCLQNMRLADWDCIVAAAYIKQLGRDEAGLAAATAKAERLLNETVRRVEECGSLASIARSPSDALENHLQGRRSVFLGIENGYAVGHDISLVDRFADKGIVYLTLCHNGHNDICDSASQQDAPEHNGLSLFGREVVAALNRRGVMVDLSHASEKTFWDALECSKAPIICSHSSVWTLCQHRRNLKDEQIRALAAKGGVMGICLYGGFLSDDHEATIKDVVAHINYVRDLVGVDYVGIGSDFDGGGGVAGCNSTSELFNLTRALLAEGYTAEDVSKVLGGNFLRVMKTVQSCFLS